MALSYPLVFPSIARFREVPAFRLVEALGVNRSGAGQIETMELADALWMLRVQTPVVSDADCAAWTAWRAALLGGEGFLGYDPGRPWPLAYMPPKPWHALTGTSLGLTRAGGGAFDGTAKVTAITATTATLELLPANFQHRAGDRISLVRPGSQRSLHEIVEAVNGNGSGVSTVSVKPPIPADVTLDSTAVQLVRPTAVFTLVPDSFEAPSGVGFYPVSFEGMQTTAPQD